MIAMTVHQCQGQNLQPAGGLSLTPLYSKLGSFKFYHVPPGGMESDRNVIRRRGDISLVM